MLNSKFLSFSFLVLALALSGCSSTPEPTPQEIEKARYERCKDFHEEFQGIAKIAEAEGGMDKNDPRLRAFGDKWNLDGCNDYTFPDIVYNP